MVEPVILELAVNGTTPRHRNRHVPRTPAEITEAALAGIESGASIVHNHNDEPMFASHGVHAVEPYLTAWRPVLERHPDALLYPTMAAGARGIPVTRRWAHVEELARRGMGGMTLVDPGSVNLGLTSAGADVVGCGLAELAIRRGGHVRVGLEDYAGPGEPSNLDLLRAAVAIVEDLGRAPATTAQARRILGIPPATRSPHALGS
jgi:uncharacterized protein (DUF849 family)